MHNEVSAVRAARLLAPTVTPQPPSLSPITRLLSNANWGFSERRKAQRHNADGATIAVQLSTTESISSGLELSRSEYASYFRISQSQEDNSPCDFGLGQSVLNGLETSEMASSVYQSPAASSPFPYSSSSAFTPPQELLEYLQVDYPPLPIEDNTTLNNHNLMSSEPGYLLPSASSTTSMGASPPHPRRCFPLPTPPPPLAQPQPQPQHHSSAPGAPHLKTAPAYEYVGVLHVAAQKGHAHIVDMLLRSRHGMDCNAPDSEGRTPLMHAVVAGHAAALRALLAAGARCDAVDNRQRSVLHLAVLSRREQMLRLLLEETGAGALLDTYDADGNTPLHLAVAEGFEAGVEMLLRSGTNLEIPARRC